MPSLLRRRPSPRGASFGSKARGCLLGLAVGDALGGPLRGRRLQASPFPERMDGPFRELGKGGNLALKTGQVSAGTQMACALSESLRALQRFEAEDVRKRYLAWLPFGLGVDPITRAVLEADAPLHRSSREVWHATRRSPAGGECLARVAPIAVFLPREAGERMRAALEDAALTHFDPRCRLASAALSGAIAFALSATHAVTPESVLEAAEASLAASTPLLLRALPELAPEVHAALASLREDLHEARKPDPQLYGPDLHLFQTTPSVQVPFRLAFWELMHAPNFEAALVDVINRGGDAAVNGAVAGALWGAFSGEEALPAAWREGVAQALELERGPLRTQYHPTCLLGLIPSES